jgi:predicted nucleic acid-binding protein
MNDLLIDSSVWIDYFRNVINPQTEVLHESLLIGRTIYICPPVWQEVLQGVKWPNELRAVSDKFSYLDRLIADPYLMADKAAKIYRSLRQRGVTIRKPNDCLIAAFAIQFDLQVVHNDIDFDHIAANLPVETGILRTFQP